MNDIPSHGREKVEMREIDLLNDALRYLRLRGFVLIFYGGRVLHAGVGAPTENETWRTALDGWVASLIRNGDVSAQHAHELSAIIEANLFDLNAVEPTSAGSTVSASINRGTAKV